MGATRRKPWLAIAVMIVAAVMIFVGITRGEPRIVEQKATNICLECIGIG